MYLKKAQPLPFSPPILTNKYKTYTNNNITEQYYHVI